MSSRQKKTGASRKSRHPEKRIGAVKQSLRTCILVLGMHRSGTSALTRVLNIAGAALPAQILPADTGNELGYWEPGRLIALHDSMLADAGSSWDDWRRLDLEVQLPRTRLEYYRSEISRLIDEEFGSATIFALKDPRICRFAPLVCEILVNAGVDVRAAFIFRNPLEVSKSLERRNGMPIGQANLLWLRHVLDAEIATRKIARACLSYEALLGDWRTALTIASGRLGTNLRSAAEASVPVTEFLSRGQRHHRYSNKQIRRDPALQGWISDVHEALLALERDPSDKKPIVTLDRIRGEFENASPVLARLLDEAKSRHATERTETLSVQLAEREAETNRSQLALLASEAKVAQLASEISEFKAKSSELAARLGEREAEFSKANGLFTAMERKYRQSEDGNEVLRHQLTSLYRSRRWRIATRLARSPTLQSVIRQYRMFSFFKDWWEVRRSGFFDRAYYLATNPDVRQSRSDPIAHFLRHGAVEGRDPSERFSVSQYLDANPDVPRSGVNPLLHFLRDGRLEGRKYSADGPDSRISPLAEPNNLSALAAMHDVVAPPLASTDLSDVSVIVPVYNGLGHLQRLLPSLAANTNRQAEIIFVDDASPDQSIFPTLKKFIDENPIARLLANSSNLGFVASVERGATASRRHFALLNTDTEVPPVWLERLMAPILGNHSIASTTPFSNSATIFSFPRFLEDNEVLDGARIADLDAAFRSLRRQDRYDLDSISAPTGVGFCMGVNGDVWREIGGFDASAFGKGYGEENDWCQRAIYRGYRSVIAADLFVYHAHGGSFGAEEKDALVRTNLEILSKRWPKYRSDVAQFIERDPWKGYRNAAFVKLCCANNPLVIIDHALGGGANLFRAQLVDETVLSGRPAITVTFDRSKMRVSIRLQWHTHSINLYSHRVESLSELPEFENGAELVYNNAVSWPDPARVVEAMGLVASRAKVRLRVLLHDHFPVCPSYTLLDNRNNYCGVPSDLGICHRCIRSNSNANCKMAVSDWRKVWGALLRRADEIVCFSKSSSEIVRRAYPDVMGKVAIQPHKSVALIPRQAITAESERLVIGVVGSLNLAKGARIVLALSKLLRHKDPSAKIALIGAVDPNEAIESPNVVVHGSYQPEELPELMERYEVNVCLLPSIWPETFSYVTQEIIACGMPLVCFDLGAPPERVREYARGVVAAAIDPEVLYASLLKAKRLGQS